MAKSVINVIINAKTLGGEQVNKLQGQMAEVPYTLQALVKPYRKLAD